MNFNKQMTKIYSILILILSASTSYAQSFEQEKSLSLSQGAYSEVQDKYSIVQVGSALYNVHTSKVIGITFVEDVVSSELEVELMGRFLSIDRKAGLMPYFSPYIFASNKPIIYVDFNGDIGWVATSDWNCQDFADFATFMQTEVTRIIAAGEKAGVTEGQPCASPNSDVCFDCADFAVAMLVRYAAENGKEIEITLSDGQVINSSTTSVLEFEGIKGEIHIDDKNDFERIARGLSDAESILQDMVDIATEDAEVGDLTNTGVHVQVINDDTPIAGTNDDFPVTQGNPGGYGHDRTPDETSSHTYGVSLKRWKVFQNIVDNLNLTPGTATTTVLPAEPVSAPVNNGNNSSTSTGNSTTTTGNESGRTSSHSIPVL